MFLSDRSVLRSCLPRFLASALHDRPCSCPHHHAIRRPSARDLPLRLVPDMNSLKYIPVSQAPASEWQVQGHHQVLESCRNASAKRRAKRHRIRTPNEESESSAACLRRFQPLAGQIFACRISPHRNPGRNPTFLPTCVSTRLHCSCDRQVEDRREQPEIVGSPVSYEMVQSSDSCGLWFVPLQLADDLVQAVDWLAELFRWQRPIKSPIRSTDRVRIWLILIQERFGRLLDSSSRVSGNPACWGWLVMAMAIAVPIGRFPRRSASPER